MHMIRYTSDKQLSLEGFILPFGGKLNPENRWIQWHKAIPWDELAVRYYRTLSPDQGRPAKSARLVIGALIIKHKLVLSDEETVYQIQENPYLQYFVGFSCFQDNQPLAPSLFVEIRKRMGKDVFAAFEEVILEKLGLPKSISESEDEETPPENKGKMLVDATVADQSIRYPTDLSLLNEAREISEQLIDELYRQSDYAKKPRTYRRIARKRYLNLAKKKKPNRKTLRRGLREQLQYLRRDIRHIEQLLDDVGSAPFPLSHRQQRQYWIIQHVYRQQDEMYRNGQKRCDDRIVSLSQPHVRPIVRGKAGKKVEFGAKLSVSMVDGLAFVDHIGWDAFNEGTDLREQVENYKRRNGYYPEAVLADQIYGSLDNRKYLKEKGVRFGGKQLGRPSKETEENKERLRELKAQRIQDSRERIPIEGKFGQGKNGYRLNYIRAKLQRTSEAWINCIFLVMNLMVLFRKLQEQLEILFFLCLRNLLNQIVTRLGAFFRQMSGQVLQYCLYEPLPF
jgi:transposase, IS5 family